MKELKDKQDLDMTEKEELDFLPSGGNPGEMKRGHSVKKTENSVDGTGKAITNSEIDREKDIQESDDHHALEGEDVGGNSGEDSRDDGTDFLVKIPEEIKSRLPEDFNFNDIGSIDLKEAEAIANEDILFLTEDDLIEGLEDFDLIPLKEDLVENEEIQPQREKPPDKTPRREEKEEKLPDIKIRVSPREDEPLIEEVREAVIEGKKKPPGTGIIKSISEEKKPAEVKAAAEMIEEAALPGEEPPEAQIPDENFPEPGREPEASLAGKIESWEGKKTESPGSDPFILKPGSEIYEERDEAQDTIPDELKAIGSKKRNIVFFDDIPVADGGTSKRPFDENELEKATSDIVEITGRNVKFLTETGIARTLEGHRFFSLMKESASENPDILIDFADFDYKYRDSELEFIDSAIFEDDYAKYIREIDDFYTGGSEKKSSTALEIFGMDNDEDGIIFDRMFGDDYRNVDLDKEIDLFRSDFGIIDLSITKERFFNYLLPSEESLTDFERLSIEEDISSRGAIIYEEDIEEVKRLFGREVAETGIDEKRVIHEIKKDDRFASEFGIEIEITDRESEALAEQGKTEPAPSSSDIEMPRAQAFEAPAETEEVEETDEVEETGDAGEEEVLLDITDNIVILEDDLDVDRFVKEFPEKKAADLKGLLKYLDGLFEKLPESTIRNFANSEYFDLYVKILSDMGI